MKTVCIIILNYGTPAMSIACAETALGELGGVDGEIVIVDNASPDDSFEQLTAWRETLPPDAPVRLILSPENGGYAAGNNLGLKSGEAEFYALANSDTLIRPGAVAALIGEMRANPRLGIVGPQMLDADGAPMVSRFRHFTPLSEFVQATQTDFFFKLFPRHVAPLDDSDDDSEIEWIGFPFVMLRKAMIDEIGRLDENYFMYFEDSAYCRNATQAGWLIGQCRKAVVQHFCGKSSNLEEKAASYARLPAYYYASRARYLITSYGRAGFVAANLFWYVGRMVSYLRIFAFRLPKKTCDGRAFDIWIGPDAPRASR